MKHFGNSLSWEEIREDEKSATPKTQKYLAAFTEARKGSPSQKVIIQKTAFGLIARYESGERLPFTGECSENGLKWLKRQLREYLGRLTKWQIEEF